MNAQIQESIIKKLGDKNTFSPKGIEYLTKRTSGHQYNKHLQVALDAMVTGTLQQLLPSQLKEKIKKLFNYETEIPDAALVILGTGRKPKLTSKGWDETGKSLLNDPVIPKEYINVSAKVQNNLTKMFDLHMDQKDVCEEWMKILLSKLPKEVKKIEVPVKKASKVVKFERKTNV